MLTVLECQIGEATDVIIDDCWVSGSAEYSDCNDTVSNAFVNCVGDYNVSSDDSANFGLNSIINQPISTWIGSADRILDNGQLVLSGSSSEGLNINEWLYIRDNITPETIQLRWEKLIESVLLTLATISLMWEKRKPIVEEVTLSWIKTFGIYESVSLLWNKRKNVIENISQKWEKLSRLVVGTRLSWSKISQANDNVFETISLGWGKRSTIISSVKIPWSKYDELTPFQISPEVVELSWQKSSMITQLIELHWYKLIFDITETPEERIKTVKKDKRYSLTYR